MKIRSLTIDACNFGSSVVDRVMLGANKVWPNVQNTAPIYLLIETPSLVDGVYYLYDSANLEFNGMLCQNTGDPMTAVEVTTRYPMNSTINLSDGYYVDTQWTPPTDSVWTVTGVYNIVLGTSYDMYTIHYKTGYIADIYLGHSGTGGELTLTYENINYIPPTSAWLIEEEPPSIINGEIITAIVYDMSTFNIIVDSIIYDMSTFDER